MLIKLSDFSTTPGLRYAHLSDDSAEEFFNTKLKDNFKQVLKNNEILSIDFNNTEGVTDSFIDEVFVQLTKEFGKENISKYVRIITNK